MFPRELKSTATCAERAPDTTAVPAVVAVVAGGTDVATGAAVMEGSAATATIFLT